MIPPCQRMLEDMRFANLSPRTQRASPERRPVCAGPQPLARRFVLAHFGLLASAVQLSLHTVLLNTPLTADCRPNTFLKPHTASPVIRTATTMYAHPVHSRTPVLLRFLVRLPSVEARGRWRERGRNRQAVKADPPSCCVIRRLRRPMGGHGACKHTWELLSRTELGCWGSQPPGLAAVEGSGDSDARICH